MAARIFLGITAAAFIGYGLVCLARPEVVANATGMNLATSTASVEVRAMYGGLQTAVGILAALAVMRAEWRTPILLCIGLLFFGLASGRLLGIVVDSDASAYNFGALAFETASAGIALALVARASRGEAARATASS